ncbi:tRNA lysidine(34) synthetase TilS [Trueperella bialowiezensis]|uniref:tRNA(Ile)-lysidine synthase n=1 Tax=Trueperella bialowiezensis TaxID=312285 RepID=A0A3S4VB56_9ACTO|nr:tRNA lysidine(34) synthetase TilS [Trueperella bialowiezensis]VEI13651.1 tRNA(Ile)-lysidine synthase [Trueperella bialowiezensis]
MSFPPPALTAARHEMTEALAAIPDGGAVLLAVSGGSDSMALTKVAMWAARGRIEVFSATIDHGLRPESEAEALAVDNYLQRVVDQSIITRVKPEGGDGPEGNARAARYARLAEIARAAGKMIASRHAGWDPRGLLEQWTAWPDAPIPVLLGHTSDDQAETVLMGLGRGSGARSIAGMRQIDSLPGHPDVPMMRPYLKLRRHELRTVCRELDLPWVDDPTNDIDGDWRAADGTPLRRSAIRHTVIPALEQALGGGVTDALFRTAAMAQEDDEFLSSLANAIAHDICEPGEGGVVVLPCERLANYPRPLRTRVLREVVASVGKRPGDLVYWHVDALDRLVIGEDNKLHIDLPGAFARRESDLLTIAPARGANNTPE